MEELKKIADDIFKRFPKEGKVFVTSDGQAFLDGTHAKSHARNNRTGKELKLETFLAPSNSPEAGEPESSKSKTAEKLINEITVATEVETVQAILDAENADGKRKTVLEAAEKKIAELSKQAQS
jgi:hypothetical protein